MNIRTLTAPAAALVAFVLVAAPAHAQRRDGDRGRSAGRQDRGQAAESARPTEPRGADSAERRDRGNRDQPGVVAVPRAAQPRVIAPRGGVPRAVVPPRAGGVEPYRSYGYRPYVSRPRAYRPYVYRPYVYRPYAYRPYAYQPYAYQPYVSRPYTFRPRLRIGFGIFSGYPVPYPAYDPYYYPPPAYDYYPPPAYGYPQAYPVPPVGSVSVSPGAVAYGGVSFEITPAQTAVYVDGAYVGTVGEFYDPSSPLSLTVGAHRVELRAPGYEPLLFDIVVEEGQVIPYRGDLQPIR